jgi:hypothetical protein
MTPERKEHPVNAVLRRAFLVAVPLGLALALTGHPPGGPEIFADVRADVDDWVFVHTSLLFFTPLLGIAAFVLLRGLEGRAAALSRIALVFFLVFYTAYEVTVGLGTGVLVDYADGLPPAEQAAVADAIQHYNRNGLLADPSISLVLGFLGWVVAMLAGAVACHRAGAGRAVTALVALSALFAVHPPPIGPIGLVCFAGAAVLLERVRARAADASPEAALSAPPALGGR